MNGSLASLDVDDRATRANGELDEPTLVTTGGRKEAAALGLPLPPLLLAGLVSIGGVLASISEAGIPRGGVRPCRVLEAAQSS